MATGLVSIIIPTLNEQKGIEKTISSIPIRRIKDELGYETEILIVDGASEDSTRDLAISLGAKVIMENRKGYGRACKSGFIAAKGDIIVTIDADSTYPVEFIPEYIRELNQRDLDFVTINRFANMERGAMSLTRRVGNAILTYVMRSLYSIDINDSQSGMWIMKRAFISKIHLVSDDMSMSEEIKIIAFKLFKALELDGKYYHRAGKSNLKILQVGWRNLTYLFQYKQQIEFAITPSSITFTS